MSRGFARGAVRDEARGDELVAGEQSWYAGGNDTEGDFPRAPVPIVDTPPCRIRIDVLPVEDRTHDTTCRGATHVKIKISDNRYRVVVRTEPTLDQVPSGCTSRTWCAGLSGLSIIVKLGKEQVEHQIQSRKSPGI